MMFFIYVKMGEDHERRISYFLGPDRQRMEVPIGSEAPAYLAIPEDIFERVINLGREHFPPETSDVRDALEDNRQVRDRLLTLVEKVITDKYLAMS